MCFTHYSERHLTVSWLVTFMNCDTDTREPSGGHPTGGTYSAAETPWLVEKRSLLPLLVFQALFPFGA